MRVGPILALVAAIAASAVGCGSRHLHGDDGSDASSVGGATGDGGASGVGGGTGTAGASGGGGPAGASGAAGSGVGGSGSCGAGVVDASADGASIPCGNNVCTGTTYCCNASCGICAPRGALCTAQFCGIDASAPFDARGCVAVPALDGNCVGARPPHFYSCQLADLPAPCIVLNVGNVTDTFCCP